MNTTTTDRVIKARYSETSDIECPCCGRNLKWLFITANGFAGGSGCVKKHLGLKVTPAAYKGIAAWTMNGWTVMEDGTDGHATYELWGRDGVAYGISINGNPQAQGPGMEREWATRYARYFKH